MDVAVNVINIINRMIFIILKMSFPHLFPSFPRKRESNHDFLDNRFRGYDITREYDKICGHDERGFILSILDVVLILSLLVLFRLFLLFLQGISYHVLFPGQRSLLWHQ